VSRPPLPAARRRVAVCVTLDPATLRALDTLVRRLGGTRSSILDRAVLELAARPKKEASVLFALLKIPKPRLTELLREAKSKEEFVRAVTAEAIQKAPEALTAVEYDDGARALEIFLNGRTLTLGRTKAPTG